jgi:hypothetical protein
MRYTKHQVSRGTKPDAEVDDKLVLIKSCALLRLTYQIRLLTYRAIESRKQLIIDVPSYCQIHPTLKQFVQENPKAIKISKT